MYSTIERKGEMLYMDNGVNKVALYMEGITKRFGQVLANNNITLELKKGEIHGLLGENGAGKTTLMNILYGLHQADEGNIFVNGEKCEITSPRIALKLGIGMVHQHFMLIDNLTVIENIILGLPSTHPPMLDVREAISHFKSLTDEFQICLDPFLPVWQLSVGDKQWLEILKLLFRNVNILILDEPTAVLTPSEVKQLFQNIRVIVKKGGSVIFISHKLDEVLDITERITVLRDGQVVGTVSTSNTTASNLAEMMVGRPIVMKRKKRPTYKEKREVLVVKDLCCNNDRGLPALVNVDLIVHSGEIIGVAGVDGNGQKELAECIAGLRKLTKGLIKINGMIVERVIKDQLLLGYIPDDRNTVGLVENFSVAENLVLKSFDSPPISKFGILQWAIIYEKSNSLIEDFDIKTSSPMTPVRQLSGGNQQKVVVARELSGKPAVVVASQPTRGLDLGAVEVVHDILLEERNRGAAVVFISTELEEIMTLSDYIIVMYKGRIMGMLEAETADVTLIGELMLGHNKRGDV